MGRLVLAWIQYNADQMGIFYPKQLGFKANLSTLDNLTNLAKDVTDYPRMSAKMSAIVSIDMRKAFESVLYEFIALKINWQEFRFCKIVPEEPNL